MANMNEKEFFFPYWGPYVMQTKVEQELIDILLEKGKKSREKNLDSRKHLAGVIKNEYYYEEVEKWFIPKFLPYVDMYVKEVKRYSNCLFKALNSEWTYSLTSLWINYQQAKEYNPPHHHTGDLSFVIYLQIPDEIKKENEKMQGVQNNAGPGCINFNYGVELPFSISDFHKLPEVGDLFIFPAWLTHHVFDFKSDVERISVSGNIIFKGKDNV